MRAWIVAAALLAACAPTQGARHEEHHAVGGRLPAPTPGGVGVRISAAQAGQTISVAVGERFAVELVGVPTAGYVWSAAQVPAFLSPDGEAGGPTSAAQNQPGFAGGSHWEVLMFRATSAGEGELVLEQRRPWESGEPPADTFRVTIAAR